MSANHRSFVIQPPVDKAVACMTAIPDNKSIYVSYYDGLYKFDHGFCMTKFNAGDNDGPDIYVGGIEVKRAGDSKQSCDSNNKPCCWIGASGKTGAVKTASTDDSACSASSSVSKIPHTSNTSAFNYEGCNRTVCNWYAADYICRNINPTNKKLIWNLPSEANLRSLKEAVDNGPSSKEDAEAIAGNKPIIQRWSGSAGLQLCQHGGASNTDGSPRCDGASRCYGSSNGDCNPNLVWGRESSSTYAYRAYLNYFLTVYSGYSKGYAYSVRCVLEKYIE